MTYVAYTPAESETSHEGALKGELFPQHPKTGFYFSAKGDACTPWEVGIMESDAMGDSRHQAPTHSPDWNSTIIVQTPTTGAESGMYNSSLPNH
jgi:hypothetical protein